MKIRILQVSNATPQGLRTKIENCVFSETGAEIQFTKMAEAKEYRETLTLLEQLRSKPKEETAVNKYPQTLLDLDMEWTYHLRPLDSDCFIR